MRSGNSDKDIAANVRYELDPNSGLWASGLNLEWAPYLLEECRKWVPVTKNDAKSGVSTPVNFTLFAQAHLPAALPRLVQAADESGGGALPAFDDASLAMQGGGVHCADHMGGFAGQPGCGDIVWVQIAVADYVCASALTPLGIHVILDQHEAYGFRFASFFRSHTPKHLPVLSPSLLFLSAFALVHF
jgi:hypothetical protein